MLSALDIVSSVRNMLLVIRPSILSVCSMFLLREKPIYNAQIAKIFSSQYSEPDFALKGKTCMVHLTYSCTRGFNWWLDVYESAMSIRSL